MAAKKLLLALLLSACCAADGAAAPEMIALTSATYDSGSADDKITAIAVDAQGNVYATGSSGTDYLSMKYSKTLAAGLPQVFSNGRSGNIPGGIAVDGLGNIVIAGMETSASLSQDYLVLKYAPNFSSLTSSVTYDGGYYDRATAVRTDDQNNIFVTGYSNDGITDNFYTIKYGPDFARLSTAAYDSGYDDQAYAMAFSGSDLVVAGYTKQGGTDYNVRLLRYDKELKELDNASFNGGADERAVGVAVEASGDIIVAARQVGATADFLTLKFDSFLNLVSSAVYDSGGNDVPTGVALDSDGNIVVTGYRAAGTLDFFTIKYDQAFNVISTAAYDGGLADQANAVAVDADDSIVVAGQTYGSTYDFFTVKYNASPRITYVDPLYIGESVNVTIKGKGLLADTAVSFSDPQISTGSAVYNSGEITLSVTPSAAVLLGVTTVTVTNINGETYSDHTLARTRLRRTIAAGGASDITAMTSLGSISVSVPAGSFAQQETLTLYPVAAAEGDIQQVGEALYLSGSPSTSSLVNLTVTLRYRVADLGGDPESSLSLAYYDAASGWVSVPSAVNTSAKTVTGSAKAAATKYAVIKSVSTGGGGGGGGAGGSGIPAKVYPNPYRPGSGGRFDDSAEGAGIVFAGLGANKTVSLTIVDLAGRLVYQKSAAADANGKYLWDTKTVSGGEAATGVYIYLITGGSEPLKGKFAIIR
ncbi:MAG: hypothetical protein M0025_02855 [Elusimicrobia bacterium]|nr:hypothetical protein [Elusimicrobiota bacterium]